MSSGTVWFDLENTPQVLFLEPILARLQHTGVPTVVTVKPQSQTVELAKARGLVFETVGGGNYRGRIRKVLMGLGRAAQLAVWALRRGRPSLLISSSRSATVAARWLGIPAFGLLDYEHSEHRPFTIGCRSIFLPDILDGATLPDRLRRVACFYPGLKENLYIDSMSIDRADCRATLSLDPGSYVVLGRPPALHAHYSDRVDDSATLWLRIIRDFQADPENQLILSPRDAEQLEWLEREVGHLDRVRVLREVHDGPSLIAAADLVVSAGGTMNREAAVLGVPAWSVFTGPPPHIDNCLAAEGRLRWVRTEAEYAAARRNPTPMVHSPRGPFPEGLSTIMSRVWEALDPGRIPAGQGVEETRAEITG